MTQKFLEQLNNNLEFKDAVLDGNAWAITFTIGIMDKKTISVRIDAQSGNIISYS
ncbi:MAG TPA: hypothetical protein VD828_00860 [Candidatus Nitrosotenuis sp.]|nr:hypothetical protein [Candidatus Nitrosotenuis sp.]